MDSKMELCNTECLGERKKGKRKRKRKRKQKIKQKQLHNNINAFHGRQGSPLFEDNNLERCSDTRDCPEDSHIMNNISLEKDSSLVSPFDTTAKFKRAKTNLEPSCSRKSGKKRERKRDIAVKSNNREGMSESISVVRMSSERGLCLQSQGPMHFEMESAKVQTVDQANMSQEISKAEEQKKRHNVVDHCFQEQAVLLGKAIHDKHCNKEHLGPEVVDSTSLDENSFNPQKISDSRNSETNGLINTIINDEHSRVKVDFPEMVSTTYTRRKRARINRKKRRNSSKSVTPQQCIEEENDGRGMLCNSSNESHRTSLSKNNLEKPPDGTSAILLQVVEDILVEEAPFNSLDAKPASQEIMKNKEENLIDSLIELSFAKDVPMDNAPGHIKEKSEREVSVRDAFHGHAVESNANKVIPSSSQLDVIHVDGTQDCMNKVNSFPLSSPRRAITDHSKKKLLILDVNGLLADIVPFVSDGYEPDIRISTKSVFKRPFCDDFLHFCFARFNVGVWSSRTKRNVDMVVDFLMGNYRHKLLFCWDQSHCTHTGYTTVENRMKPLVLKELKKLWEKGEFNESNTLLLDDSPYKALRNPAHTAIFPPTYDYRNAKDTSLGPGGDLRLYLEGLAVAENVKKYVEQNPFGQGAITESDPSWGFYRKILYPS